MTARRLIAADFFDAFVTTRLDAHATGGMLTAPNGIITK
jgi:hypothetical protein